jgi:Predicted glycosyltransferases
MPSDAAIKLSVVILNHNSGHLLRACLDSIFAVPPHFSFEVIVSDNDSHDNSLDEATSAWANTIRILKNGTNLGFAFGMNRGIEVASGRYVCLLNPDTVVHSGAFDVLIGFLDSNPRAGFVGPKVLAPNGEMRRSSKRSIPTPFDAVCHALHLSRLFPKSRRFARYETTYLDGSRSQHVDATDGCCIVVRRTVIDEIGMLDEGYFIYCEDVDWFLRAKWAGWEVWYIPEAEIMHNHAHTQRFRRYRAIRDFHNSMIRFHRKFYANQYAPPINVLIIAGVRLRMYFLMGWRTLTGWN